MNTYSQTGEGSPKERETNGRTRSASAPQDRKSQSRDYTAIQATASTASDSHLGAEHDRYEIEVPFTD